MLDDLSERIFTLMQRSFESTGILLPEQIPNYLQERKSSDVQTTGTPLVASPWPAPSVVP